MAEIGIKVEKYSSIAAVVKVLRDYSSMSISDIKAAIEKNDYVYTGSSYEDGELEKIIDCYTRLTQSGTAVQLYEDGDGISFEILLNIQQRNYEISNEVEAEEELEQDDTDIEVLEPFSYLWEEEFDDWVVIKDENGYSIYNTETQSVLLIEDEDLNNKVAAMMVMQGCEVCSGIAGWPYEDYSEDDFNRAVEFVEEYAESLGAKYICTKREKFTTFSGEKHILEINQMRVYQYKDEYFWVESHFLPDKPFMVMTFGDTIETIFDDADPFPYDLPEEELKAEVRYSLGIEPYPEN